MKADYKQTWCEHMHYDWNFHWQVLDGTRKVTTDTDWVFCPKCGKPKPSEIPPLVCTGCGEPVSEKNLLDALQTLRNARGEFGRL